MNEKKELKPLALRTKANDVDEEKGIVTIAVNGIGVKDSQGDISDPGSFDKTIQEFFLKRGKHLLDHDKTKLIGCPIEAKEENGNLIVVSKMNLSKQIAAETFEDYKLYASCGKTLEHSIGVRAIKRDEVDPAHVKEWFLAEVSTLQAWGANPQTFLVDIKATDDVSTQRDKMKAALEMINKALTLRYSDNRLKNLEMNYNVLLNALTGKASLVTCPHCGQSFDYDAQNEITFSNQVLELAAMYQRWITENIVRQEMEKLTPEIQSQVLAVLDAFKSTKEELGLKSIEDFSAYVRCPHCWSRVYRTMIAKVSETTEQKSDEPAQTTQQKEGEEKLDEKHTTSLFSELGHLIV